MDPEGDGKVRGTKCEEGIVQESVRGIRARNRTISKAVCEAAVLCAIGKGARVTVSVKAQTSAPLLESNTVQSRHSFYELRKII